MERKDAAGNQHSKILETAGRLFLERGYDGASIRQIAKELDISPGLIGYYFPTKRDIAFALFSRQLERFIELDKQYVSEEDPVLRSAVLIKLQITVLSSPTFKPFYIDALREDIILDVIRASGLDTYHAINRKYNLGYSDCYLMTNDLIAASMERTLVLYSEDMERDESIADLVFSMHMGRIYGSEEFLKEKCRESELITARIILDHPEMLQEWL